jgi:hypothetical protein
MGVLIVIPITLIIALIVVNVTEHEYIRDHKRVRKE